MNIFPIRTENDYDVALVRIDQLMNAQLGTAEGDELDILVTLVEVYEAKHYAMPVCDPVEAIKFRMEQMGLEPKDLTSIIGSRSKVSEVLNHKRQLSIAMIRNLHAKLHVPYESLLGA
ncbi:MAG TPA: DNA-binding protein [Sulfuricurvum sp.]|nr:MAG: DNA-binding protein [Campylobacterales bacterium 16-40-21]OZA02841.1 MAG: DNA-binding protein [Sulfuricurvum sp. 17-40-25]HQS67205.1 DNA-binding protein [Sulfuricurvum sp.]HQT37407.1 DNA-binding protein [Sulfuricurvum sp.]